MHSRNVCEANKKRATFANCFSDHSNNKKKGFIVKMDPNIPIHACIKNFKMHPNFIEIHCFLRWVIYNNAVTTDI